MFNLSRDFFINTSLYVYATISMDKMHYSKNLSLYRTVRVKIHLGKKLDFCSFSSNKNTANCCSMIMDKRATFFTIQNRLIIIPRVREHSLYS